MDKGQDKSFITQLYNAIEQLDYIDINFGPVLATISWEPRLNEVGSAFKNWFGKEFIAKKGNSYLRFLISPSMFEKALTLNLSQTVIQTWAWNAVLLSSDQRDQLWICSPRYTLKKQITEKLPRWLVRFANPLFATYWELQAGYLLYHVFMRVLYKVLLIHDACFVHAAAISDTSGNAVLICGSGGVGKTTSSAYFASKGWKIIADDFVIASKEGKLYDSHLPSHLYGYHAPIIKQLGLKNDTMFENWLDKLHWKIYSSLKGPDSVVRRIPIPDDIRSPEGNIRMCFIVSTAERSKNNRKNLIQRISCEEAAQSALGYTEFEIYHKNTSSDYSSQRLDEDHKAIGILSKAFSNTICYRIEMPKHNSGFNLATYIWQIVSESLPLSGKRVR